MKSDLSKGWSSAYTFESVIMQIAASIGTASVIEFAYMDDPAWAKKHYAWVMQAMGWGVPRRSAD